MLEKICEGKSVKEIASELNIPISTLYYKIRKLKEEGIIKEKIEINWRKLGFEIDAIVFIETENLSLNDQKRILEALKKNKRVINGAVISGRYDIMVEVIAKDIKEFGEILDWIKRIPGVKRTETFFKVI